MSFVPDPNRYDPSRDKIDKDKYVPPKTREPVSRPERLETDERRNKFKEMLSEQEKADKEKAKKTGAEGESLLELATQLAAASNAPKPLSLITPDTTTLSTKEIEKIMPDILAALEQEATKALVQTSAVTYANIEATTKAADASTLSETRAVTASLAEQMIEKLVQIEKGDRLETTLTLKYPPLFENVQIRIDQYHSAQKEFNITFINLTNPDARALIEMKPNQEALHKALAEQGYVLHMITIEPKVELAQPSTFEQTRSSRDQKQQQDENQGEQEQELEP
jgi:hypothetical protein